MTQKKKISIGLVLTVGVGAAIGTALLIKKLVEGSESYQNRSKESDALDYLKEKYGDDALEGKKVVLVDKDKPVTRTQIAKDIVAFELQ